MTKRRDPTISVAEARRRGAALRHDRPERFWARTAKQENDCVLWLGRLDRDGYGRVRYRRRVRLAHRLAWELTRGPIPPGACVLHNCPAGDTPRCVNPEHLWLGTQRENNHDMRRKGRQSRVFACGDRSGARTHPELYRGEANARAKLTEDQVRAIREMRARGVDGREVGAVFGVSRETVYGIAARRKWRHVA